MNKSKYDEFGILKTIPWENIKKGDFVEYASFYLEKYEIKKEILYGIWDGEKVEFDDKNKHVIRTTRWLKKQ